MPIYEFQCDDCLLIVEEYFHVVDRVRTLPCKCGGTANRILSLFFSHSTCLEGGHNGRHLHVQSGTWYSSNKELEMKNKKKGLEEIPSSVRRDCESQRVENWQNGQKKIRQTEKPRPAVDLETRNKMAARKLKA